MRTDGRNADQLRPVNIVRNFIRTAEGSVLIESGETRVICTASIEAKVPPFLRDKGRGWVTGEYSMLPRSTSTRSIRESAAGRVGGRTHEIQRLIGRAMRSVVDLEALGERTIWLDCDVIQADGGTRTASISGAFIAMKDAVSHALEQGIIQEQPIREYLAAVSVGIVGDEPLLDLCYVEDSSAEVDMNIVMTESGRFIEVQGTAETQPFSRQRLNELLDHAEKGIREIIAMQRTVLGE